MVTKTYYEGIYEIREYYNYGYSKTQFKKKTYLLKGVIHREDGPAVEMYGKKHKKTLQWFNNGEMYYQERYFPSSRELQEMTWWKDNKLHRDDDLPAKIYWKYTQKGVELAISSICICGGCYSPGYARCGGSKIYGKARLSRHARWYINGKLHREKNQPAKIGYIDDEICYENYFENGLLHSTYGPAVKKYYDPDSWQYAIKDKIISSKVFNNILNKITLLQLFNTKFGNYEKYLINEIITYI